MRGGGRRERKKLKGGKRKPTRELHGVEKFA